MTENKDFKNLLKIFEWLDLIEPMNILIAQKAKLKMKSKGMDFFQKWMGFNPRTKKWKSAWNPW